MWRTDVRPRIFQVDWWILCTNVVGKGLVHLYNGPRKVHILVRVKLALGISVCDGDRVRRHYSHSFPSGM